MEKPMLNVIPFVREGLGNSSYLIQTGEGQAALIDPDRWTVTWNPLVPTAGESTAYSKHIYMPISFPEPWR